MVRESPRSGLTSSRLSSAVERARKPGKAASVPSRVRHCGSRYHPRQWCQNCNEPCGRIVTVVSVSTAAIRSPSMSYSEGAQGMIKRCTDRQVRSHGNRRVRSYADRRGDDG